MEKKLFKAWWMMYKECAINVRRFKLDAIKIINSDELKIRIRTIFKISKRNYENVVKIKYLVFQKTPKKD